MPKREDNIKKHNETKTWAQRRGLGKAVRTLEGRKGEVVREMAKNKEPKPEKPEVVEEPVTEEPVAEEASE